MSDEQLTAAELQDRIVQFVRAFGLHQQQATPCGQPIPVSEAHALAELARDAPLTQVQLGQRLRLEKSTVSRLVSQLATRGWVRRDPNPADGRAFLLGLTEAGQSAAGNLATARQEKFTRLLAGIPAGQHDAVMQALKILTEAAQ